MLNGYRRCSAAPSAHRLVCAIIALVALPVRADDGPLIDAMDSVRLQVPAKASAKVVEGKVKQAVEIGFEDACQNVYVQTHAAGTPDWDEAAGFSFWVKGDGSDHLGGIELIWNDDYALRYAFAFPIDNTDWRKVVVRWRDLVPETANPAALPIDPKRGNAPSKLGRIWFGKWWYWQDYAAHAYAIDEIRLETSLDDEPDYRPVTAALARVQARLEQKQPVKMVLMGDSLTDVRDWANRQQNWPAMFAAKLLEQYDVKPTLVNTALGGTELRQNLVLIPRWASQNRDVDLVIICFGGNDWSSGMRGALFEQTNRDAIDRVRRATAGRADVLLCTTCPSVERWDTMAELSAACRAAARGKDAGLADIDAAFHAAGATQEERERLFVSDKTHLSPAGHQVFAESVFKQLSERE